MSSRWSFASKDYNKYWQRQTASIYFTDHNNHTFMCNFKAPNGQILQPGIYKNAARMGKFNGEVPELDISGFGRGYNDCSGEFEIFDIQYDDQDRLLSFAVDWLLNGQLRGSIRFNSTYPVDEYFIKMTDPHPNLESKQLLYVMKHNKKSQQSEDIILVDRKELSISVENKDNELNIMINEAGHCHCKDTITFHIPNWLELNKQDNFIIRPKLNNRD